MISWEAIKAYGSVAILGLSLAWPAEVRILPYRQAFAAKVEAGPIKGNDAFYRTFKFKKEYLLEKQTGKIRGLVVDGEGFFWVEDIPQGRIEKYDQSGKLVRVVGGAGQGPGRFLLLNGLALDEGSGRVLAVDTQQNRVNVFNRDGQFISSWIVAKPGYMPQSIVFDAKHGFYYLGGSLPLKTFISEGCLHVHKYSIASNDYLGSFLETDRIVKEKNLFNYLIVSSLDVDGFGNVYCTLAPVYKVFKLNTKSGEFKAFRGRHSFYREPPFIRSDHLTPDEIRRLRQTWTQAERVLVAQDRFVVLSLEQHEPFPYALEVFDLNGNLLQTDMLTDGRLVGKDKSGGLYFALFRSNRYLIARYELVAARKLGRPLERKGD